MWTSHNVQRHKTFGNAFVMYTLRFLMISVLWRCTLCDVYVLKTLRFGTLTLCAATFCNTTSCNVYVMLLYVIGSNIRPGDIGFFHHLWLQGTPKVPRHGQLLPCFLPWIARTLQLTTNPKVLTWLPTMSSSFTPPSRRSWSLLFPWPIRCPERSSPWPLTPLTPMLERSSSNRLVSTGFPSVSTDTEKQTKNAWNL